MGTPSDIERLIELGLNRYGAGDLDGALLMWEEALAIDPDNAQVNSYIDYVRLNWNVLNKPQLCTREAEPFALSEEPDYEIEIRPGELIRRDSHPVLANDQIDAGWFDEATRDAGEVRGDTQGDVTQDESLELEADEPPPPEVSFEDATREYYGATQSADDGAASNSDFNEGGTQEYRQTSRPQAVVTAQDLQEDSGAHEFASEFTDSFGSEGTPVGFAAQETEIRKRNFGFVQPASAALDPSQERTKERDPFKPAPNDEELLAALPRPGQVVANAEPTEAAKTTRELPDPRPPARRDAAELSQAEVMLQHARTQDFDPAKIDITAPTRELGLRPPARPQLTNPDDDDLPTKQSDVRAIREAAARDEARAARTGTEGTRHDIVLPFDPIDARTAQILDEVDADAPADEEESERTRRRIGALLDKAIAYDHAGETDKAVAAVDLALSEDPNSALGQKLITRNRDTIMQIFQSFIGDLDRTPELARPLHELHNAPISPRAAFLLSRIDGALTIDELLDVSGMPRMEAYRYLCQLLLRGILR